MRGLCLHLRVGCPAKERLNVRILLIAGAYPPRYCGVGDYVKRLAQALAALQGVTVAVLTQKDGERSSTVEVEVIEAARSWRMREAPAVLRRIRRWKPDLVHLHYPSQGFGWRLLPALLPLLCKASGARVVQTWHEPWPLLDAHRFLLQRLAADGLLFVRPEFCTLMPAGLRPFMPACPMVTIGSAGSLPASRLTASERVQLRSEHLRGQQALVVFFGFVHPAKGVEQLFDIADPATHSIVIVGPTLDATYQAQLQDFAATRGWAGRVHYAGYLEPQHAADLIACADAVVLPFLDGGGDWNTSIHAALAQGTLVITTATRGWGDDPARNLYTARISDVEDMSGALRRLAGRRTAMPPQDGWVSVAQAHAQFYRTILQHQSAR